MCNTAVKPSSGNRNSSINCNNAKRIDKYRPYRNRWTIYWKYNRNKNKTKKDRNQHSICWIQMDAGNTSHNTWCDGNWNVSVWGDFLQAPSRIEWWNECGTLSNTLGTQRTQNRWANICRNCLNYVWPVCVFDGFALLLAMYREYW